MNLLPEPPWDDLPGVVAPVVVLPKDNERALAALRRRRMDYAGVGPSCGRGQRASSPSSRESLGLRGEGAEEIHEFSFLR